MGVGQSLQGERAETYREQQVTDLWHELSKVTTYKSPAER